MRVSLRGFFRDPLNIIALLSGLTWFATAIWGRPMGDFGVETDFFGDFISGARRWMHGDPAISGFRGPLYYLVLGLFDFLFRDGFLVGKLISVFSAAAAVRLAGGLLRKLFNPTAAVAGSLFLVANPHVVSYAFRASTDMFFWLLFLGTLVVLYSPNPSPRRWALAGLLAGAAWLTRYNGLALLPACLVAFILVRPYGRAAKISLAFAGAWLLVALPWSLLLWQQKGDPFWNTNFKNIATAAYTFDPNIASRGFFWDQVGFESLHEVIATYPELFFRSMGSNFLSHFWRDVLELVSPFMAIAAILGVLLNFKKWRTKRLVSFGVIGVLAYLALVPAFYNPRFMVPLLLWWAAGVGGLVSSAEERWIALREKHPQNRITRVKIIPKAGLLGLLGLLCIVVNTKEIAESVGTTSLTKRPARAILDVVRQINQAGIVVDASTPIAARKPHIGYLLGAPVVSIPYGTVEDLRETGAHFLLVSGVEMSAYTNLRPLAWPTDLSVVPTGLTLLVRGGTVYSDGRISPASFYKIDDPVSKPAESSSPTREERSTLPGLSRLEYLRLRLAGWYHNWEPGRDVRPLLEKMSPSARKHPMTLQILGDESLMHRDLEQAGEYYRRAVEASPDDEAYALSLASTCYLAEDPAGFQRVVTQSKSVLPRLSQEGWCDLGTRFASEGRYSSALAAFVVCNAENPDQAGSVQGLGGALRILTWTERAREIYEDFLERNPNDPTIRRSLSSLRRPSR